MKIQDSENPLTTKINDIIEHCKYANSIKIEFEIMPDGSGETTWFKNYDLLLAFIVIDATTFSLVPYEFADLVNSYLVKQENVEKLFASSLDYDFYKEKYIL